MFPAICQHPPCQPWERRISASSRRCCCSQATPSGTAARWRCWGGSTLIFLPSSFSLLPPRLPSPWLRAPPTALCPSVEHRGGRIVPCRAPHASQPSFLGHLWVPPGSCCLPGGVSALPRHRKSLGEARGCSKGRASREELVPLPGSFSSLVQVGSFLSCQEEALWWRLLSRMFHF